MKLRISLTSHKGRVELVEKNNVLRYREFAVDNDLSNKLLREIDVLVTEAQKEPLDIESVEYSAHEAGLTTTRIGETIAQTYNFGLRKTGDSSQIYSRGR